MRTSIRNTDLAINLKGDVFSSHALLGMMIRQQRGVIITLGSVDGLTGSAAAVEYSVCKSGLIGWTKSLALFGGAPHGVPACCVSPGPVFTRPSTANTRTSLGRAAQPEERVNMILYVGSDDRRLRPFRKSARDIQFTGRRIRRETWTTAYGIKRHRHQAGRFSAWDLICAMREGHQPVSDIQNARLVVDMIQGIYASHFSGGAVTFPLADRNHPLVTP